MFQNMIQEWEGTNQMMLEQELDLVQVMARNSLLQWYYKFVRSKITNMIEREKDVKNLKEMPMTKFLFTFIRKIQKCSENKEFIF